MSDTRLNLERVATGVTRTDEERAATSGDIVEVLKKYCHGFDARHIHEVCDRAAAEIERLRFQNAVLKQHRSLSKQVEALEQRLEHAERVGRLQ
jgi:hypothetical protein